MTHSLTHFHSGCNRTLVDEDGCLSPVFSLISSNYRTNPDVLGLLFGGPTRIRTWNQRIHVAQDFRPGVDYLITLSVLVGCGMLEPVIKGAVALR